MRCKSIANPSLPLIDGHYGELRNPVCALQVGGRLCLYSADFENRFLIHYFTVDSLDLEFQNAHLSWFCGSTSLEVARFHIRINVSPF